MRLRYELVPGLTDDAKEMRRVAEFASTLGVVEPTEILPFHQLGKYKWERLGLDYRRAKTGPPSGEAVAAAINIFRKVGLNAD
jgi:pyruvate formate lyase activating enzyme